MWASGATSASAFVCSAVGLVRLFNPAFLCSEQDRLNVWQQFPKINDEDLLSLLTCTKIYKGICAKSCRSKVHCLINLIGWVKMMFGRF